MRRVGILFLLILLMKITCFSAIISNETKQDSVVTVTNEQIKYANLIFVEHEKLLIENSLLNTQINNYQTKINYLEEIDSINQLKVDSYNQQILNLNKTINNNIKTIKYLKLGCFTVTVGAILLLIFK